MIVEIIIFNIQTLQLILIRDYAKNVIIAVIKFLKIFYIFFKIINNILKYQ